MFSEIDAYKPSRPSFETLRISKEYPVLFRLMLTTGLRRSEAVSIPIQNIDVNEHTVVIRNAKEHKDRIVSISDDMALLLKGYLHFMESTVSEQLKWLFPAVDLSCHLSAVALGDRFNRFWNKTMYAQSCSKKPTLHSLRHTFVVTRINSWNEQGIDTAVMIPYLSRHLGHKSADETFYYYHQVLDSLKIIRQKDTLSSIVLPEVRVR
ncbi:tyrosine-type recombinase/integrase [Blautia hominis]|uniref:tyrosine-type recombinase/integrase n=1 Tax=Blautia hominis TaxID=2025493 RepID=UPI0036F37BD1